MLQPHQSQISLTTLPFSISASVPESDGDARYRRRKDLILFVASLLFVAIFAIVAMWTAFIATGSDKQREWGMAILLLIAGGSVGFLTGKNDK